MLEAIKEFFAKNPHYFGIIFCAAGVLMLMASVKNWDWFFRGPSWNLEKIEGINNFWGRTVARIVAGIGGIVVIIAGIVWFLIYAFYY